MIFLIKKATGRTQQSKMLISNPAASP